MLLYQSNQKLKDLFPLPRTFTDRSITIKKPKHCQYLENFQDFALTANTDEETRNSKRYAKHSLVEECLVNDLVKLPLQNQGKSNDDFKIKKRKFTNNLMGKCEKDVITNFFADNQL